MTTPRHIRDTETRLSETVDQVEDLACDVPCGAAFDAYTGQNSSVREFVELMTKFIGEERAQSAIGDYLKEYIKPTFIMLPFNIISEISRTLSLAIRLYGNVMSSSIIVAILLGVVPLFFPVVIQALGLLTGVIQAYIFAILAIVYIASATERKKKKKGNLKEES